METGLVLEQWRRAVVRVWRGNPKSKGGGDFLGTAFAVSPTQFVTAKHVVFDPDGQQKADLILDGTLWAGLRAVKRCQAHGDSKVDMALILIEKDGAAQPSDIPPWSSKVSRPQQGDEVTILGFDTRDRDIETAHLQVQSYDDLAHAYVLAPYIAKGLSGGPALAGGELAGIVWARNKDKQKTYLTPLNAFLDFLVKQGIELPTAKAALLSRIESADIEKIDDLFSGGRNREAIIKLMEFFGEFHEEYHDNSIIIASSFSAYEDEKLTGRNDEDRLEKIQFEALSLLGRVKSNTMSGKVPPSAQSRYALRKEFVELENRNGQKPVFSGKNLLKRYTRYGFALSDVSFDVFPGDVIAVVGANASGKTTLLNLVAGRIPRDGGEIAYPDISPAALDWEKIRNEVVYIDQYQDIWEDTPREKLLYTATIKHHTVSERQQVVSEYLFKFALEKYADSKWLEITSGTRARFELVRALLLLPKLLILDEPVAHTDPYWTRLYLEELYRLSKGTRRHISVLFSSQNIHAAEAVCDKILVLDRGNPIFFGTPFDLNQHYNDTAIELELVGSETPALDVLKKYSPMLIRQSLKKYTLLFSNTTPIETLLSDILSIHGVTITSFKNLNFSAIRLLGELYESNL